VVGTVFALSGIAAAIVYVLAVIIGGALRPGYSHISQFVSELIASEAPNKPALDALFAAYNALTVAFGWALVLQASSTDPAAGRSIGIIGAIVLIIEGIIGLAILFFPQDPVGTKATPTGTTHIVLAGLSSLATVLAILFIGLWLGKDPNLRGYAPYSFITVAFIFISGGVAAATAAVRSPLLGLTERLPIAGFLQWIAVMSLAICFRVVNGL
jgi:hypothetical protein